MRRLSRDWRGVLSGTVVWLRGDPSEYRIEGVRVMEVVQWAEKNVWVAARVYPKPAFRSDQVMVNLAEAVVIQGDTRQ